MIEIKELIIRAKVEDTKGQPGSNNTRDTVNGSKSGCCEENVDMILKIIKEKKER